MGMDAVATALPTEDVEVQEVGEPVKPQREPWPLWKLAILAMPQMGVQILWCFLGPNGSTYMLRLGMGETLAVLNNIAGPITGFFTGPLAGAASDSCTSKWGRRRPMILFGLASFGIAGMVFAGAEHVFGDYALFVAAPMYWVLDVTINILQTPHRALVADFATEEQQVPAQVLFVFVGAIGNILGFRLMTIWEVPVDHMAEIFFGIFCINALLVAIQFVVAKEVPLSKDANAPKKSVCAPLVEVTAAVKSSPPLVYHLGVIHCLLWVALTVWNLYGGPWFEYSVFEGDVSAPEGSIARQHYAMGNAAFSESGQWKAIFQLIATYIVMYILTNCPVRPRSVYAPLLLAGAVVCFLAAFAVGHDAMFAEVMMVLSASPEVGCWTVPYGLIAIMNKKMEKEGGAVSTALQMALLNCCITMGQQITTMTLAGLTNFMSYGEALTMIMVVAGGALALAGASALFLNDSIALEDEGQTSTSSDANTSDEDSSSAEE